MWLTTRPHWPLCFCDGNYLNILFSNTQQYSAISQALVFWCSTWLWLHLCFQCDFCHLIMPGHINYQICTLQDWILLTFGSDLPDRLPRWPGSHWVRIQWGVDSLWAVDHCPREVALKCQKWTHTCGCSWFPIWCTWSQKSHWKTV